MSALSARVGLTYCVHFSAYNTLTAQYFETFPNPDGLYYDEYLFLNHE